MDKKSTKTLQKMIQSLIRRENGIFLKSLQTCNQIATHILILSQIQSIISSTPPKILLFRSNQIAQKVAITETFQRIFPVLDREKPRPKVSISVLEQGITQCVPNFFKMLDHNLKEKSQCRKRWSLDSLFFLHKTHHPGDRD